MTYAQKYYRKNKDKYREYKKIHKEKNPNYNRKQTLKKYGLTIKEFDELSTKQNGCCAVCGNSEKLHVDHNHQTGKVRGLLCRGCNTALGSLKENPDTIQKLKDYIIKKTTG